MLQHSSHHEHVRAGKGSYGVKPSVINTIKQGANSAWNCFTSSSLCRNHDNSVSNNNNIRAVPDLFSSNAGFGITNLAEILLI